MVNAITWFNLLWLNLGSIVAELRAMQPNPQIAEAIRWMEQDLPKSQMPRVASRLEEIIDAIKLNGRSVEWASGVITEFRKELPRSSQSSGGKAVSPKTKGAFPATASITTMSPFP